MEILWLIYLVVTAAAVGLASLAVLYKQQIKKNAKIPVKEKTRHIQKELMPVGTSRGWRLWTVSNGLRVWQQVATVKISWTPSQVYGSFTVIAASLQEVMDTLKDTSLVQAWIPGLRNACQVWQGNDRDLVSIVFVHDKLLRIWDRAVLRIREMAGVDTSVLFAREWHVTGDIGGWLYTAPFQQSDDILWTCCLVTSFTSGDTPPQCIVSMMACSLTAKPERVCRVTSERLVGLKDYFLCKNLKYLSSVEMEKDVELGGHTISTNKIRSVEVSSLTDQVTPPTEGLSKATDQIEVEQSGDVRIKEEKPELVQDTQLQPDHSAANSNNGRYNQTIDDAKDNLAKAFDAEDGDDGWIFLGYFSTVNVMKKPFRTGERLWDCFKGTTTINVPIHYVLAYVFSLDERGEWDERFNEGKVIEAIDPITQVIRMRFKPTLMSTPRDLCAVGAVRVLDRSAGVYGVIFQSVKHAECPEMKGYIRAEMLLNGIVVKELGSDPYSCQVSLIQQLDVKGYLNTKLVNRVAQPQIQNIAVFRRKLESRYSEENDSPDEKTRPLQEKADSLWSQLMRSTDQECACSPAQRDDVTRAGFLPADTLSSGSDNAEDSDYEDAGGDLGMTDDVITLQLMNGHKVDYSTLGNKAVATLLGELDIASKVEIPITANKSRQMDGEWGFETMEKDVVIIRKDCFADKLYSVLGKGIIKTSPLNVWQAVTNDMARHVYDRTLKKLKVVKQIDEDTKIVHTLHQAAQCFVKQARDFVILTMRRKEPDKFIYAAVSVDSPECPVQKGVVRAKVLASGWVIEPVLRDGQLISRVSYLAQIDVGESMPPRLLINYVVRRQPLCIAYLREFLEKL